VRPARPGAAAPLVLGAALSTQLGSALATRLFTLVPPGGAAALRLAGAAAVMALLARPAALRRAWAAARRPAVALGVATAAMNVSFYEAIARIPLGAAVTLEFLGPIALAVAASRRRADVALAVTALAGVALVSGGLGGAGAAAGAGFALLAGACWAAYLVAARRLGAASSGPGGLALGLAAGAALTAPLLAVSHPATGDVAPALALGLLVGVLGNALPFSLEIAALRRAPIHVVAVLLALEPAVAALVGFAALGQGLSPAQVAGVALVVAAGAGVTRAASARATPPHGG
jgi:inner membrane transporter RhtA